MHNSPLYAAIDLGSNSFHMVVARHSHGQLLILDRLRETYGDGGSRRTDMLIAFLAVAYTTFLVYAAGPKHLLLSCLLYAPAAGLYVVARREHNARIFTAAEGLLFAVIALGAVLAVVLLSTGRMSL